MTKGFFAELIAFTAFFSSERDGEKVGGSVKMGIFISP
jgi:hypothetical protein